MHNKERFAITMIILTGGAGFIGTNMLIELNKRGEKDILLVDNLNTAKKNNLIGLKYRQFINKELLWNWLASNKNINIDYILHLGACSNTTETNWKYLEYNNISYSKKLWNLALEKNIPLIYASSAATYGDGSMGFSDSHNKISKLKPLNLYGKSKHEFDLWILQQKETPPKWIGLKYFNVYGPYEGHKGRMASVVWHFLHQLNKNDKLNLFGSSHGYKNGEQKRDFIYIDDVIQISLFFCETNTTSGIYNIGTGQANTFNDLANTLIEITGKGYIDYISFPNDLIDKYQAFTEAEINKYIHAGYNKSCSNIYEGIQNYLNYLYKE